MRAPTVDIMGSFFPIWMFCIIGGIVLTLLFRFLLVHARLDEEIGPRVIVYPGMATLIACAIWLVWFQN
jgi:hypothetical protein